MRQNKNNIAVIAGSDFVWSLDLHFRVVALEFYFFKRQIESKKKKLLIKCKNNKTNYQNKL